MRGSGRFSITADPVFDMQEFQSPSLRGSGRFQTGALTLLGVEDIVFQSPSLRGSGRFKRSRGFGPTLRRFQSPSLRGSGRFSGQPQARPR